MPFQVELVSIRPVYEKAIFHQTIRRTRQLLDCRQTGGYRLVARKDQHSIQDAGRRMQNDLPQNAKQCPAVEFATGAKELAAESSYRRGLVVHYVEDGVQLRILQHVVDLLGQVQQLQLAALVADRSKGPEQGVDARTVNVVDVAQVQQDFLVSLAEQTFDRVAQHRDVFALLETSTQVNDGDAIYLPGACFYAHVEASWRSGSVPWNRLIKVISVHSV